MFGLGFGLGLGRGRSHWAVAVGTEPRGGGNRTDFADAAEVGQHSGLAPACGLGAQPVAGFRRLARGIGELDIHFIADDPLWIAEVGSAGLLFDFDWRFHLRVGWMILTV